MFRPIAKYPDSNNELKMKQKLLSWISLPLDIYLSEFDLFNIPCFLSLLDGQFGCFVFRTSFEELY